MSLKIKLNLFAGVLLILFGFGCAHPAPPVPKLSESEAALAAFKQVTSDYLKSTDGHEEVFHQDFQSGSMAIPPQIEGWRKWHYDLDRESASFDVKKTESLVSPYLGTLAFVAHVRRSQVYASQDEARQATELSDSDPSVGVNHLHTYAYQDGKWTLKSRDCKFTNDGDDKWDGCYALGEDW
jgi:hypothetical protein